MLVERYGVSDADGGRRPRRLRHQPRRRGDAGGGRRCRRRAPPTRAAIDALVPQAEYERADDRAVQRPRRPHPPRPGARRDRSGLAAERGRAVADGRHARLRRRAGVRRRAVPRRMPRQPRGPGSSGGRDHRGRRRVDRRLAAPRWPRATPVYACCDAPTKAWGRPATPASPSPPGELIGFCDADDWWKPNKASVQVADLAAHPEVDIVLCRQDTHYRAGRVDPRLVDPRPALRRPRRCLRHLGALPTTRCSIELQYRTDMPTRHRLQPAGAGPRRGFGISGDRRDRSGSGGSTATA